MPSNFDRNQIHKLSTIFVFITFTVNQNIMDAHERSQGCSGNAHAHGGLHIPLKLYSNHINLPSLYNLMYNFSSSVKDLAPAPKHVLKLGQYLNNQQEHCNKHTLNHLYLSKLETIQRYSKLTITRDLELQMTCNKTIWKAYEIFYN